MREARPRAEGATVTGAIRGRGAAPTVGRADGCLDLEQMLAIVAQLADRVVHIFQRLVR